MNPKVSVIIPVYNTARFLEEALRSLQSQTYKDFEAILINDGSTDGSLAICRTFAETDPRFIVIDQKNQGQSAARNAGLDLSRGEYIGFLDSDDHMAPEMLRTLVESMEAHSVDAVFCDYFIQKNSGLVKYTHLPPGGVYSGDQLVKHIIRPMIFSKNKNKWFKGYLWRSLYKRASISRLGIRFEKLKISEDMIFNLRYFLGVDSVAIVEERLYYYRLSPESLTKSLLKLDDGFYHYDKTLGALKEYTKLIDSKNEIHNDVDLWMTLAALATIRKKIVIEPLFNCIFSKEKLMQCLPCEVRIGILNWSVVAGHDGWVFFELLLFRSMYPLYVLYCKLREVVLQRIR